MADETDFDPIVETVLQTFARMSAVPVVEFWEHSEAGIAYLRKTCRDAAIFVPSDIVNDPRANGIHIPHDIVEAPLHQRMRHFIVPDLATDPVQCGIFEAMRLDLAEWCRQRHVKGLVNFPLGVGSQTVGALCAYFPDHNEITESHIELGYALSGQITLALRLAAVGEPSKPPTIVRELEKATWSRAKLAMAMQLGEPSEQAKSVAFLEAQERAAQARAADLEQLNTVLTRGAERVAKADDLDGVLVGFLLEAKQVVGAYCAAAFRLVERTRHTPLAVIVGETVLTAEEIRSSPVFLGFEERSARDESGLFTRLARGEAVFVAVSACEPCLYPEALAYHQTAGNLMVWHLPLILRDSVQGYVALGIQRMSPPAQAEERKLDAIRQHMTLAFELRRLAEEGERAAILAERTRLARDIHDTLAQGFLGILLHLETARRTLTTNSSKAVQAIEHAHQLAQTSLNQARRSVGMLRASTSQSGDLVLELGRLARESAMRDHLPVRFDTDLKACDLPLNVRDQVVRIVAEAIQNAQRHARPTQILVSLAQSGGAVRATVTDNGVGFDAAAQPPEGRFGLVGMRERAAAAGCELTIHSGPDRGTTAVVTWSVPHQKGGHS
jgi:signal transduction histidine kinase